MMPTILPLEDEEIAQTLQRNFKKNKIDILAEAKVEEVKTSWGKKEMTLQLVGEGDLLLERWAVSRKKTLFGKTFGRDITIKA